MTPGHNTGCEIDPRIDAYDPPCPEERFTRAESYTALVRAWDLMKLVLARFWTPTQLLKTVAIRQWRMYECIDLLRAVELMLRRLIFIEARALAPGLPEARPAKPRASKWVRPWPDPSFDSDNSTTWRTSFRGLPEARLGRPHHPPRFPPEPGVERLAPRDHGRMRNPWPLAYRLEAAIRVLENPLPWIRRLAQRMRLRGVPDPSKLASPHRIRIPRALPALNPLADLIGIPRQVPEDSS